MIVELVAVLICIIAGLWMYARWNYGSLEQRGIPVVKYTNPILGSARDLYENSGGPQDVQWMRKYGTIFGVYEGRVPTIFVCVPELIRLICVKDQEYFNAKRVFDFGDPLLNEMPDFLPYDKWKVVRSMTTPAFSSAKLKMMNLPMREAAEDFVADIKAKIKEGKGVSEKFAIDVATHTMLTDMISRAFFSVQIPDRTNRNNEFAKIITESLTPMLPSVSMEVVMYTHTFPFLQRLNNNPIFSPESMKKFVPIFKYMMDERRKSGQKRNDLIDMCLEWWDKLDSPEYNKAKISELTLLCQALVFFVAAQDQVSTMVASVIYHMTQDPDLEKKIYDEVDSAFEKNNGKLEHEHWSQLTVLQACIQECLRLYPVFHRTERMCTKDYKSEEYNISFKKGDIIVIPIWALNRNKDYVENPDQFDYDRFMPENKDKLNPFASTSFGHGPRNCTGKRFALEAIPLILAYLLRELKFVGREDSKIKMIPGGFLMTPHEPIHVDVVERKGSRMKAPSH